MENKTCGIVRDLMPLVLDEVSSDESKALVEDHMKTCANCRDYFEGIQSDPSAHGMDTVKEEQMAFDIAAARMKRKIQLRTLSFVLLGVMITLFAFLAGLYGVDYIRKIMLPADLDAYRIFLAELDDGTIAFSADYKGSMTYLGATIHEKLTIDADTGERMSVLYLGMEKYLIHNDMARPMHNGSFLQMAKKDVESFEEIRQGTEKDYKVIWRAGEGIAQASQEMEEYYLWKSLHGDALGRMIEIDDGKMGFTNSVDYSRYSLIGQQLDAIRATVPEWQPWLGEKPVGLDEDTIKWLLQSGE